MPRPSPARDVRNRVGASSKKISACRSSDVFAEFDRDTAGVGLDRTGAPCPVRPSSSRRSSVMAPCPPSRSRSSSRCSARRSADLVRRDLRVMAWLAPFLVGRIPIAALANPPALVEVFAETISEELDFRLEAENMLDVARSFAELGQRGYVIPRPHPDAGDAPRARDGAAVGLRVRRRRRASRTPVSTPTRSFAPA